MRSKIYFIILRLYAVYWDWVCYAVSWEIDIVFRLYSLIECKYMHGRPFQQCKLKSLVLTLNHYNLPGRNCSSYSVAFVYIILDYRLPRPRGGGGNCNWKLHVHTGRFIAKKGNTAILPRLINYDFTGV